MTERKLKALKDKNEKEYLKLAHFMRLEFQKCLLAITKKACEEINLQPALFQKSVCRYLEDPARQAEIDAMEKRVRLSVEGEKITQTAEQVLSAAIFEHRSQRDLTRRLEALSLIHLPDTLNEVETIQV